METANSGGLRQRPFGARGQARAAIHRLGEEIAGTISPQGVDGFGGNLRSSENTCAVLDTVSLQALSIACEMQETRTMAFRGTSRGLLSSMSCERTRVFCY
jgi:hypothetical protein